MEELDNQWIEEYENKEKEVIDNSDLEVCPTSSINVFNLYVNKRNVLEKIKVNQLSIDNMISEEDLTKLIKEKMIDEKIRYKLLSILKYNITLEKGDVHDFINDKVSNTYLESISTLSDIDFKNGLNIFEDLHSLYIIFLEKSKYNITRRNLTVQHNKTRRKLLKDLST